MITKIDEMLLDIDRFQESRASEYAGLGPILGCDTKRERDSINMGTREDICEMITADASQMPKLLHAVPVRMHRMGMHGRIHSPLAKT
jgi:hypothetical protein